MILHKFEPLKDCNLKKKKTSSKERTIKLANKTTIIVLHYKVLFLKSKADHVASLLKIFQWLTTKAKLLINARKTPAYVSVPIPDQSLPVH